MRRAVFAFIALCVCLSAVEVQAQTTLGLKGGLTLANLNAEEPDGTGIDLDRRTTFGGGAYLQMGLGDVLTLGQVKLKVLYTPGHSVGSISLLNEEEKAVFDGDVLFNMGIGRTDLTGGNFDTLMDSIRNKLLTLPDDTVVYSGHGPATTIGRERAGNPFLTGRWL